MRIGKIIAAVVVILVVVVAGVRTPFVKSGTDFEDVTAVDLGVKASVEGARKRQCWGLPRRSRAGRPFLAFPPL